MGVICVGVPWGGGAFVSIPSKSSSCDAQEPRAVPYGKKHDDTCAKSLGHRAIEWIVNAGKKMRCRFAEFRKNCCSEEFFAIAFLKKKTRTTHLCRTELSTLYSLMGECYQQRRLDGTAIGKIKEEIGKYLVKSEGMVVGTQEFRLRQFEIYSDMARSLSSKCTRQQIRNSQSFFKTHFG